MKNDSLLSLGLGIGIGALSLWVVIELFPLIVLSGAGYLVLKGLQTKNLEEETYDDT